MKLFNKKKRNQSVQSHDQQKSTSPQDIILDIKESRRMLKSKSFTWNKTNFCGLINYNTQWGLPDRVTLLITLTFTWRELRYWNSAGSSQHWGTVEALHLQPWHTWREADKGSVPASGQSWRISRGRKMSKHKFTLGHLHFFCFGGGLKRENTHTG